MEVTVSQPKGMIDTSAKKAVGAGINFLILLAFCADLFTPFLIWKGYLPAVMRWISQGAIAVMVLGCITRMIVYKRFPKVIWLMIGASVVWAFVAIAQGQGITSTAWGWWLLLQFPFIGLFMYLEPALPTRFSENLRLVGMILLVLQVGLQFVQYVLGEVPGDNLAGFFAKNGTANAAFFALLLNCLFLGYWITTKKWLPAVVILFLSILSTTLGEVKLFPVAIAFLGLMAMIIFAIKYHTILRILGLLVLIAGGLVVYNYLYDIIIPDANRIPLQTYLTDPRMLDQYLNISIRINNNGTTYTNIGRSYALQVGWESLQRDPVTLLFGWGIGARSESVTLGTAGVGLKAGDLGLTSGTSLLVMMQELGMVGLAVLALFFIWLIYALARDIRRNPQSPVADLRYGLILFTTFWPVWMWYSSTWKMRVPMIIYWCVIGYVMAEARQHRLSENQPAD